MEVAESVDDRRNIRAVRAADAMIRADLRIIVFARGASCDDQQCVVVLAVLRKGELSDAGQRAADRRICVAALIFRIASAAEFHCTLQHKYPLTESFGYKM